MKILIFILYLPNCRSFCSPLRMTFVKFQQTPNSFFLLQNYHLFPMPHHYLMKNLLFLFTDNYRVQKVRTRNEIKQNSRISHAEQIRTSDVEQILSSPPLLLLFLFPSHYLHIFSKPKNGWMEWEKMIKTKQVKHKNRSKKKEK